MESTLGTVVGVLSDIEFVLEESDVHGMEKNLVECGKVGSTWPANLLRSELESLICL